jgi:hypothetical protein
MDRNTRIIVGIIVALLVLYGGYRLFSSPTAVAPVAYVSGPG